MTRDEIIRTVADLKFEKAEIESKIVTKVEKKRYGPRLKIIHRDIAALELELAVIRQQLREESQPKPRVQIVWAVGDQLPLGSHKRMECPYCGSPGSICENEFCSRRSQ